MSSSRLPGKVLLPADGKPMLEHLVNRLKRVESLHDIVLATTVNPSDDELVEFAIQQDISFFRGSEDDVMKRVIDTAESVNAEVIVEITGDCPLLDSNIVEQTIQMFLHNTCEYISTGYIPSYPAGLGDNQVYFLESLKRSEKMTTDAQDREHVTTHIKRHPELFPQIYLVGPPDLSWPELHLLLDEDEDYQLLKKIIEYFGSQHSQFTCKDVIELLRSNLEWVNINKDVKRTVLSS